MMSVVLTGLQGLEHFWLVLCQVNNIQASFIVGILVETIVCSFCSYL